MERLQVEEESVKVLTVTVLQAKRVSFGFSDHFDVPDPYVKLRVITSPNARQQTSIKKKDPNPEWNESFNFYLNPEKKNTLEMIIMDDNVLFEKTAGKEILELDDIPVQEHDITRKIQFNKKTSLDISLRIKFEKTKQLRFSYDICDAEKDFVNKRKEEIFQKISNVLPGNKMPNNLDEVPTIAIMGSGGGYRAACGLSGTFCALQDTGILDCATYVSGLSGSSWYLSTLYSNESWPHSINCYDVAKDLRKKFNTHISSHLRGTFHKEMEEKKRTGQPVSFTDLFGMIIGDALLDNKLSKLSNQAWKIESGKAPLPLLTGLRVRKNESAEKFSEWVEFSPFEFGLAKYGVFAKTSDFGAKFYKGHLVKEFEETPLHYLQGIWGSAFSVILLNRIVDEEAGEKIKAAQMVFEFAKNKFIMDSTDGHEKTEEEDSEDEQEEKTVPEDEIKKRNWLKQMLKPKNVVSSRKGKAAQVFNMCRGLKFKNEKDEPFVTNSPGRTKTMCLVDAGIAFNSPYPALVRAERNIDLILSFDFSQRDGGDNAMPFEELLKAEVWAKANGIPFPPIATNPVTKESNIRECYVFEDPEDLTCPTILHFVLINKTFKEYIAPGIPRKTEKDKKFADFSIFDDPMQPYSSFKFTYDGETFDRLHELAKFNLLLNLDLIKEKIAYRVRLRRNNTENELL